MSNTDSNFVTALREGASDRGRLSRIAHIKANTDLSVLLSASSPSGKVSLESKDARAFRESSALRFRHQCSITSIPGHIREVSININLSTSTDRSRCTEVSMVDPSRPLRTCQSSRASSVEANTHIALNGSIQSTIINPI